MSEKILADCSIFADYAQRMSLSVAANRLGISVNRLKAAIESGELRYMQFPGSSRKYVTPKLLEEWIETHCTYQNKTIP
jgi:hypothetical protein